MQKVKKTNLILFSFLIGSSISQVLADPIFKKVEGFWIYGFEHSTFETCDGKLYWMWTPGEFKGTYKSEGHRNPVEVSGYLLPPNPEDNMYSTLPEIKVVNIKYLKKSCQN